jgi:hypothetical protein
MSDSQRMQLNMPEFSYRKSQLQFQLRAPFLAEFVKLDIQPDLGPDYLWNNNISKFKIIFGTDQTIDDILEDHGLRSAVKALIKHLGFSHGPDKNDPDDGRRKDDNPSNKTIGPEEKKDHSYMIHFYGDVPSRIGSFLSQFDILLFESEQPRSIHLISNAAFRAGLRRGAPLFAPGSRRLRKITPYHRALA